tara:strand:+ start:130 stop:594 length:465 start_codon:yes stop_codon:yes gene_type:complete
MMYKRTPFRDRAIDAMKSKEPESTMSTDGEDGVRPLFPKLAKKRKEKKAKREERKAERGLGEKSSETVITRRSKEDEEDFRIFHEEEGGAPVRPETYETSMTRRGLKDKIKRIKQGGSTGFVYDESGNPLFGKERRKEIRERVKKARQDYRNQP